jgi:hypothetical protein
VKVSTGQGIMMTLAFFQSSSRTPAWPPVLLDIGDDDLDDLPTVQEEVPPPYIVIYFFIFQIYICVCFL